LTGPIFLRAVDQLHLLEFHSARSKDWPVNLQVSDPFLLGGMIWPCFLLEGSHAVFEELLLREGIGFVTLRSYTPRSPGSESTCISAQLQASW
jgi:hypothetical protein